MAVVVFGGGVIGQRRGGLQHVGMIRRGAGVYQGDDLRRRCGRGGSLQILAGLVNVLQVGRGAGIRGGGWVCEVWVVAFCGICGCVAFAVFAITFCVGRHGDVRGHEGDVLIGAVAHVGATGGVLAVVTQQVQIGAAAYYIILVAIRYVAAAQAHQDALAAEVHGSDGLRDVQEGVMLLRGHGGGGGFGCVFGYFGGGVALGGGLVGGAFGGFAFGRAFAFRRLIGGLLRLHAGQQGFGHPRAGQGDGALVVLARAEVAGLRGGVGQLVGRGAGARAGGHRFVDVVAVGQLHRGAVCRGGGVALGHRFVAGGDVHVAVLQRGHDAAGRVVCVRAVFGGLRAGGRVTGAGQQDGLGVGQGLAVAVVVHEADHLAAGHQGLPLPAGNLGAGRDGQRGLGVVVGVFALGQSLPTSEAVVRAQQVAGAHREEGAVRGAALLRRGAGDAGRVARLVVDRGVGVLVGVYACAEGQGVVVARLVAFQRVDGRFVLCLLVVQDLAVQHLHAVVVFRGVRCDGFAGFAGHHVAIFVISSGTA